MVIFITVLLHKLSIVLQLLQIPDLLGCAMTYTLFEWVKENYDDLVAEQPESQPVTQVCLVHRGKMFRKFSFSKMQSCLKLPSYMI